MTSLRFLYKIGPGPSSSHTMGPQKAAKIFKEKNPDAFKYKVELWGSLAATGKGHLTDHIIIEALKPKEVEIIWKPTFVHPYHTNGMKFYALDENDKVLGEWTAFSVGGGIIMEEGEKRFGQSGIYPLNKMDSIIIWCKENNKELWQYVDEYEEKDIWDFLEKDVWGTMSDMVKRGLSKEGSLPGSIQYPRKAKSFLEKSKAMDPIKNPQGKELAELYAYTLAASEENGSGGQVVTAPTCGAAGVIPGVLNYLAKKENLTNEQIVHALAVAGVIGNVAKDNASISGAEAGCQAEVGVACCMAAGLACWVWGGTLNQIEYAAEIAMEHHLGLTCDPVRGLVQIPCIERNAVAAVRALDAARFALLTNGEHHISYDNILKTMMETGRDIMAAYRETSEGGIAKTYDECSKCNI